MYTQCRVLCVKLKFVYYTEIIDRVSLRKIVEIRRNSRAINRRVLWSPMTLSWRTITFFVVCFDTLRWPLFSRFFVRNLLGNFLTQFFSSIPLLSSSPDDMTTKQNDPTLTVAVEDPPPPLTVDVTVDDPCGTDNDGRTVFHSNRSSRAQEKEQLQTLNDRLVTYIDRVRCLEAENSRLVRKLYSYKEHNVKEMAEVKKLFELEIRDLRSALDRESVVKSQLELDNKRKVMQLNEVDAQ